MNVKKMNVKKSARFFLIGCLIMIFTIPIFAAELDIPSSQLEAGKKLQTLGLLKGYENGDLGLEKTISRAEIATLMVRISGYEDSVVLGVQDRQFTDVANDFWAKDTILKAANLEFVTGYPDGSFRPNAPISYAEGLALMVRVVGQDKNLTGGWPDNYILKGKELGLINANREQDPNQPLTRGEVAEILWNTLLVRLQ